MTVHKFSMLQSSVACYFGMERTRGMNTTLTLIALHLGMYLTHRTNTGGCFAHGGTGLSHKLKKNTRIPNIRLHDTWARPPTSQSYISQDLFLVVQPCSVLPSGAHVDAWGPRGDVSGGAEKSVQAGMGRRPSVVQTRRTMVETANCGRLNGGLASGRNKRRVSSHHEAPPPHRVCT